MYPRPSQCRMGTKARNQYQRPSHIFLPWSEDIRGSPTVRDPPLYSPSFYSSLFQFLCSLNTIFISLSLTSLQLTAQITLLISLIPTPTFNGHLVFSPEVSISTSKATLETLMKIRISYNHLLFLRSLLWRITPASIIIQPAVFRTRFDFLLSPPPSFTLFKINE